MLAVLAVLVSYARAAEDVDISQKILNAKTAADHEAIAKYYDEQAAEATKGAARHRQMAESYRGLASSSGKGAGVSAMPQHCEALVKDLEAEAAHYKAMAETHRALAKTAK